LSGYFDYKSISSLEVREELFLQYNGGHICLRIAAVTRGLKRIAFADEAEK
jgi:hypothetical protein